MNILVAGDLCPQKRVADALEHGDYQSVLGEVKNIIDQSDYAIVNFECPITKGGEKAIAKQGPNLQCSSKGMEAVKWAGFKGVTLANNHIRDFDDIGVMNTLDACQVLGIDAVGGGMNVNDASKVLYKSIKGKELAIINCCEHEYSIATDTQAGANPLNLIQQYYAIQEAKKQADYVLVIVHGGHEHYQLPSPRMVETYRFFIDAGADAVVNGHQHCFSGFEFYNGKPIVYGLGNLCFDNPKKRNDIWNEGYMAEIDFSERGITLKIHPYIQCDETIGVHLLDNRGLFDEKIKDLNKVIASKEALSEATKKYYRSTDNKFLVIHEPYNNKWLKKLYSLHFLPSFVSKNRMLKILNFIECESHRDRHIYAIKCFLNL